MSSTTTIARAPEGTPFDENLNLLVLGESGVGKTCLVTQYLTPGTLTLERPLHFSKVPVDVSTLLISPSDKTYRLNITATAGEGSFGDMTEVYLRGAMGVAVIYDVYDTASFEAVYHWYNQICATATPQVPLLLIGNKVDDPMPYKREITTEQGRACGQELGATYFETSAMTGSGAVQALDWLVRTMVDQVVGNPAFDDARSHTTSFRALGWDDEFDEESEHESDPEEDQATPTPEETPAMATDRVGRSLSEAEDGKSVSREPSVIGMDVPVPHAAGQDKW